MLYARESNFSALLLLRLLHRSAYSFPATLNNCSQATGWWHRQILVRSRCQPSILAAVPKCINVFVDRGKRDSLRYDISSRSYGGSSSFLAATVCSRLSWDSHKLVEIVIGVAVRDVSVCELVDGWAFVTLQFGRWPKLCGGYGRSWSLAETETRPKLTFDPVSAPKPYL